MFSRNLARTSQMPAVAGAPRAARCVGVLVMLCAGCSMSATGYNIDGVRSFQQGQYHTAIQSFQQALVSDPRSADAYYNLAATYHYLSKQNNDSNQLKQAEGLYHQCLDLNPESADCHRALAVLLIDSGRPQSAFTLLERWMQRNPGAAEARIELARLYEEFGDREAAKRYLAEALDTNPHNPRAWAALGRLREGDGQLAQALNNYEHAYRLNQYQPGVASRIASLQQSAPGGVLTPVPDGTRTVNNPRVPTHW